MRLGDKIDTDGRHYVVTEFFDDDAVLLVRHDEDSDFFYEYEEIAGKRIEADAWEVIGRDYSGIESSNLVEELRILCDRLEEAAFEFASELEFEKEDHDIERALQVEDFISERVEPPSERCKEIADRMEDIVEELEQRAY